MNRRKLLTGGSAAFVSTVAGCLQSLSANLSSESGKDDTAPQLPDGMTIDVIGIEGQIIKPNYASGLTAVSNEVAADVILRVGSYERVDKFVNETDFSSSYIVAIDSAKSPGARFRVNSIQRTETGIVIDYSAFSEPDEAISAVSVTSAFVIRITDENGAVPDTISARFNF
jgi:hypothetical protein